MKQVKNKLIRSVGRTIRLLLMYLNPLNIFEGIYIRKSKKQKYPPIFIIGAPRSGTTLLYQLLTYHFELSYFSNFVSTFVKSPVLMAKITSGISKSYDADRLESNYGLIKGIWAPSEAGKVFKHWFQRKDDDKIKNSIHKMSQVFNAPFIAKNLRINSELEYIHHLFPDAVFIHIKRDITFNAQSLILGIKDNKSDVIGNIMLDNQREGITNGENSEIFKRIVKDINDININITEFFSLSNVNGVSLTYEALCKSYDQELKKIEKKLNSQKIPIKRKNKHSNLELKASKRIKLSKEDWEILKNITEKNSNEYSN